MWKNILKTKDLLLKLLLDSNACSTNPCLNGATCTATGSGSSYTCTCAAGYSGTNCQICNIINYFTNKLEKDKINLKI